MTTTATLIRDITAEELAMDSADGDEGYGPEDVIGRAGTTVIVTDLDGPSVEVEGFSEDPCAWGWIPASAIGF